MKRLTALAWKEWNEVRPYLWIGLGIFLALPVIGGVEAFIQRGRRFEILATPWVLTFGGVLAIFIAVGITCRDLDRRLEDFWRSRPVSITRWLMVKYFIGLAVVLVSCVLPLAVELQFNRDKDAQPLIAWFPFFWMALYSIGFLIGCLVGRAAHAGMLALAAMLLLYFLPAILPPLAWLNNAAISDTWEHAAIINNLKFAGGMLGISAVCLLFALLTIRRDWHIDSGRRMMYGSVSAAILLLFASAAFQLGTNLPVLQTADLPEKEIVQAISCDGSHGFLVTRTTNGFRALNDYLEPHTYLRAVDLIASSIKLGDPINVDQGLGYVSGYANAATLHHPEIRYAMDCVEAPTEPDDKITWKINVYRFDNGTIAEGARQPGVFDRNKDNWPTLFAFNDRLYAIGRRLMTFDITDPLKPRPMSDIPFDYRRRQVIPDSDTYIINLPPIPDLAARQRLEAAYAVQSWWRGGLEGDLLCNVHEQTLLAYRLTKLTDNAATFEKIGQYEPTMLEKIFGSFGYQDMQLCNGLLYMTQRPGEAYFNPHISIFDVQGPHPLRLIAHFAAPGVNAACPLPDGRALVGGSGKLWLVGPPPDGKREH